MTTRQQLQQWRDDGVRAWMSDLSIAMSAHPQAMYAAGYLRAKQATKQAIKDARKPITAEDVTAEMIALVKKATPMQGVVTSERIAAAYNAVIKHLTLENL